MTRIFLCIAPLVLLLGGLTAGRASGQSMDEYKVKALFLYNFAKFVDWPADVFRHPTDPIAICVLGLDPFGVTLDEAVLKRAVGDRPLVVRRLSDTHRAGACQILFVSSSERKKLPSIFDAVKLSGVLTVGDTDDFTDAGGAVRLMLDAGKIRFEINQQAATEQRLRISSNVLNLAKIVKK